MSSDTPSNWLGSEFDKLPDRGSDIQYVIPLDQRTQPLGLSTAYGPGVKVDTR